MLPFMLSFLLLGSVQIVTTTKVIQETLKINHTKMFPNVPNDHVSVQYIILLIPSHFAAKCARLDMNALLSAN